MLRGVIFDLDGTLVESNLDFHRMRREMGLVPGEYILEAIQAMDEAEARRCELILQRHEIEGARQATLVAGAADLLEKLERHGLPLGVVTRNSRQPARAMLARLLGPIRFDPVLTREDGPIKPDPWAIHHICRLWNLRPSEVVIIGDFHLDIDTGRLAGARTVLYTRGRDASQMKGAEEADLVLDSLDDAGPLLAWLDESA